MSRYYAKSRQHLRVVFFLQNYWGLDAISDLVVYFYLLFIFLNFTIADHICDAAVVLPFL